jgi:Ca2+-binding RTX toxin-like protein
VDNSGDIVVNPVLNGIDTVNASVSFTLPNNVENLNLTGTLNILEFGNSGNNIIIGNAGNNTLGDGNPDDGADSGDDTIDGGDGTDTIKVCCHNCFGAGTFNCRPGAFGNFFR